MTYDLNLMAEHLALPSTCSTPGSYLATIRQAISLPEPAFRTLSNLLQQEYSVDIREPLKVSLVWLRQEWK